MICLSRYFTYTYLFPYYQRWGGNRARIFLRHTCTWCGNIWSIFYRLKCVFKGNFKKRFEHKSNRRTENPRREESKTNVSYASILI